MIPGNIDPRRPDKQQRYKPPPTNNNAAPGEDLTPDYMNILDPQKKSMHTSHSRSDRFKVVKIESTEPFKRGRWECMDFLDQSYSRIFQHNFITRQVTSDSIVHSSSIHSLQTEAARSVSRTHRGASNVDLQSSMLQIFYRQNNSIADLERRDNFPSPNYYQSQLQKPTCSTCEKKYRNHVLIPGMVSSSLVGIRYPFELNFVVDEAFRATPTASPIRQTTGYPYTFPYKRQEFNQVCYFQNSSTNVVAGCHFKSDIQKLQTMSSSEPHVSVNQNLHFPQQDQLGQTNDAGVQNFIPVVAKMPAAQNLVVSGNYQEYLLVGDGTTGSQKVSTENVQNLVHIPQNVASNYSHTPTPSNLLQPAGVLIPSTTLVNQGSRDHLQQNYVQHYQVVTDNNTIGNQRISTENIQTINQNFEESGVSFTQNPLQQQNLNLARVQQQQIANDATGNQRASTENIRNTIQNFEESGVQVFQNVTNNYVHQQQSTGILTHNTVVVTSHGSTEQLQQNPTLNYVQHYQVFNDNTGGNQRVSTENIQNINGQIVPNNYSNVSNSKQQQPAGVVQNTKLVTAQVSAEQNSHPNHIQHYQGIGDNTAGNQKASTEDVSQNYEDSGVQNLQNMTSSNFTTYQNNNNCNHVSTSNHQQSGGLLIHNTKQAVGNQTGASEQQSQHIPCGNLSLNCNQQDQSSQKYIPVIGKTIPGQNITANSHKGQTFVLDVNYHQDCQAVTTDNTNQRILTDVAQKHPSQNYELPLIGQTVTARNVAVNNAADNSSATRISNETAQHYSQNCDTINNNKIPTEPLVLGGNGEEHQVLTNATDNDTTNQRISADLESLNVQNNVNYNNKNIPRQESPGKYEHGNPQMPSDKLVGKSEVLTSDQAVQTLLNPSNNVHSGTICFNNIHLIRSNFPNPVPEIVVQSSDQDIHPLKNVQPLAESQNVQTCDNHTRESCNQHNSQTVIAKNSHVKSSGSSEDQLQAAENPNQISQKPNHCTIKQGASLQNLHSHALVSGPNISAGSTLSGPSTFPSPSCNFVGRSNLCGESKSCGSHPVVHSTLEGRYISDQSLLIPQYVSGPFVLPFISNQLHHIPLCLPQPSLLVADPSGSETTLNRRYVLVPQNLTPNVNTEQLNSLPTGHQDVAACVHSFLGEERQCLGVHIQNGDNPNRSGSSNSIDTKIEALMDLVKKHLKFAVLEDVNVLKQRILVLKERVAQLEYENELLKRLDESNNYKDNI